MAREERGPLGGTFALLDLIEEHRSAVTWDLRRYLGLSIADLGDTVTWGEATLLITELGKETGSHLFAALAGYRVAASQAELAAVLHAEAFVNAHRDREKHPEPFRLPSPLVDVAEDAPTDVELEQARELLEKYSMFAD